MLTERPDEHMVWHDGCVFLKPLPDFLLCHDFWERHLCRNAEPGLYPSVVGLVLSYAWLVQYRNDFDMSRETRLLPQGFEYAAWTRFVPDFLRHIDLYTMEQVDRRYRFGELRLSRLNSLTRYAPSSWSAKNFVYGHMNFSTRYKTFFDTNLGWPLAVLAYISVILSAIQSGMSTDFLAGSEYFQRLSYGISLAALAAAFGSVCVIFLIWFLLLWYHLLSTFLFVRRSKALDRI